MSADLQSFRWHTSAALTCSYGHAQCVVVQRQVHAAVIALQLQVTTIGMDVMFVYLTVQSILLQHRLVSINKHPLATPLCAGAQYHGLIAYDL